MKKKYIVAILLGLMTCMLTGCSTDSIPSFHAMLFGEEEYVSLGYDPSDYVTLGKYKNIEVEKSVSDGDVQSALDSMIAAGDEKEVKSSVRSSRGTTTSRSSVKSGSSKSVKSKSSRSSSSKSAPIRSVRRTR